MTAFNDTRPHHTALGACCDKYYDIPFSKLSQRDLYLHPSPALASQDLSP